MVASPQIYITPEEYLELEENSPIKYEYIDGYIYAMAGALEAHVTIALNLATLLRNYMRGSGCRVYISDMKARIESLNRFFYPDIMVTCDKRDQDTPGYKRFPCLIIEFIVLFISRSNGPLISQAGHFVASCAGQSFNAATFANWCVITKMTRTQSTAAKKSPNYWTADIVILRIAQEISTK